MRLLSGLAALALAAAVVPAGSPAAAQTRPLASRASRPICRSSRRRRVRAGVSRATIASVFPSLVFSARTVELDRAQPGGRPGSNRQPALRALSRPPRHLRR